MAMANDFLQSSVIFLSAAVVAVPIAQRFGLGSVLGYLLAGVAIGLGDWVLLVMSMRSFISPSLVSCCFCF